MPIVRIPIALLWVLAIGPTNAQRPDATPASPDDGGPRYWQVAGVERGLNLREAPSAQAPVVGHYAAGDILNNLSCEIAEGRGWCYVQALGGGPVGYVAADFLAPAVSPHGAVVYGADDSALRAGQADFDATGVIPCAQAPGQPTTDCAFGVARGGGGDGTVVVTRPDGTQRAIFFQFGRPMSADTSEADYGEFSATREADLNFIRVGSERYEIPDAVIFGG